MRNFLLKIVVFIAPIVILSLPLDLGLSYLLRQSNQYPGEFEVMNDIYESKARCDIAIYGSSRAWVQISPKIIEESLHASVYNFGIDGHNFWLQYLRHLEFLKYNQKPKQIILSVDVFSLEKRSDLYYPDQFLPYMLWDCTIKEFTDSYLGYKNADYYMPLIRYSGRHNALKTCAKILIGGSTKAKFRHQGYAGMDKTWNSDLESAQLKKEKYTVKPDSATIILFEKFINECKELNINLVLVYTPEYIEGQAYVSNREQVMNIFRKYALKYHLPFFDYSANTICRNKRLFYNASHLNKSGAELFSKILVNDLKTQTHAIVHK